jgi:hypothetical protein
MRKLLMLAIVICTQIVSSQPSQAQQLIESYQAFLGQRDHVHPNGERLYTAAAIIRRDRENFHQFGLRDPGDEDDSVFADKRNRAALERWMERGTTERLAKYRIVNRTPLVRVEVFRGPHGRFVNVTILD